MEETTTHTTWQVVAAEPIAFKPNGYGIPTNIPAGWRSFVYDQEPKFFRGAWLSLAGPVPAENLRVIKTSKKIVTVTTEEVTTLRWVPDGPFTGSFETA